MTLGASATGGAAGTKDVAGLDQQIAATPGVMPRDITITDVAVHPKTRNTFVSVMRGQGADANSASLRVDGAGAIQIVDFAKVTSTHVALPNAPDATPAATRGAPTRAQSITDMAYTDGRAVHRRIVERQIRPAPLGAVSLRSRRQRHQRRDFPRQPRRARDAVAGLRVRSLPDRESRRI